MKLNWGFGIAVTLVLFTALMGFMAYKASQQNFDLVSDDYYAEEIAYQDVIDQKVNALKLQGKASLAMNGNRFLLKLPEDLAGKTKTVKVWMYCELKAADDFHFNKEETSDNSFQIPLQKFSTGKWIAKVNVNCDGVNYYFEPEVVL